MSAQLGWMKVRVHTPTPHLPGTSTLLQNSKFIETSPCFSTSARYFRNLD